jgi:DNA repair ATPase RecN
MAFPWTEDKPKLPNNSQVPELPPIISPPYDPPSQMAIVPSYNNPSTSTFNRIDQLETRLNNVELTHKMLLEEVAKEQPRTWTTATHIKERHFDSEQMFERVKNTERRLDSFENKMEYFINLKPDHTRRYQTLEDKVDELHDMIKQMKKEKHQDLHQQRDSLYKHANVLMTQGRYTVNEIQDVMEKDMKLMVISDATRRYNLKCFRLIGWADLTAKLKSCRNKIKALSI